MELWSSIAANRLPAGSPFIDFALPFLHDRFPGEPERAVVVHGDPGVGNLLWLDGAITAMLDWELTHAGDPYDDLAFLAVRLAMHGIPLAAYGKAVREHYFGNAEAPLDPARLRYWQAVAVLRSVITCEAAIANPVSGGDQLVHRLLLPSLNRLLVGTLAAIDGLALPEPRQFGPPPDLPGAETLAQIAAELSALLPGIEDPDLRQRGRHTRYLLDQFAATWPLAGELAAAAAAEAPPASDPAERLAQLASVAEREIVLFPRAGAIAHTLPQGF